MLIYLITLGNERKSDQHYHLSMNAILVGQYSKSTLILGPGGYRFGDYWRMGLPLEILVVAVSIPAILIFWPL